MKNVKCLGFYKTMPESQNIQLPGGNKDQCLGCINTQQKLRHGDTHL